MSMIEEAVGGKEEKPWDIPNTAPLRPGDNDPKLLEQWVGRALSTWDDVESALSELLQVVTAGNPKKENIIDDFGRTHRIDGRIKLVKNACGDFFLSLQRKTELISAWNSALDEALGHYKGWSARRNDIAHGKITESSHPDYTRDEQPIITTYSLCPSHSNRGRWSYDMDPEYHYNSDEMEWLDNSFRNLDEKISQIRKDIEDQCMTCG